jgi:hypothetical protein
MFPSNMCSLKICSFEDVSLMYIYIVWQNKKDVLFKPHVDLSTPELDRILFMFEWITVSML